MARKITSGSNNRRVGRPTKAVLSRRAVIETALRLIDDEGLADLSLKSLAAALGVHESSIYYHYRYKDEILRDVLRHVLSAFVPLPPDSRMDWKEYFLTTAPRYYSALAAHPELVKLLDESYPQNFALQTEEYTAQVLKNAGFPDKYILPVRDGVDALVTSILRAPSNGRFDNVPDDFPALRHAVAASSTLTGEQRVRFAVEAYLNGLEGFLSGVGTADKRLDKPSRRAATARKASTA